MRRIWGLLLLAMMIACGRPSVADWFSEDFALGSPLRAPVDSGASHVWWYYSIGHTSQYTKLIQARDSTTAIEVDDDAGVGGTPALQSPDSGVSRRYATFALRGTAAARQLTDPGIHVIEFDVKFIGSNDENLNAELYSSVSMSYVDLGITINASGTLYCNVSYQAPNGVDFGITSDVTSDYVIGAVNDWRTGGLFHTVRVEVKPGTVATWTPGTFNGDNDYTGGTLEVASDGYIKLTIDGALVQTWANLPLIFNYEGQSANETAPGDWVADSFGAEASVGTLSMIDVSWEGGSAVLDNITVGPLDAWVDIAECVEQEISSSIYPGGSARILGYLWSAAVGSPQPTVQSRLYNVTDGVSVGESALVQSDEPVATDFAVTLTPGTRRYRQQVTSDVPEVDIFWSGRGVGP